MTKVERRMLALNEVEMMQNSRQKLTGVFVGIIVSSAQYPSDLQDIEAQSLKMEDILSLMLKE